MRRILVTAALAVGVAATVVPAAPASAYCEPITSAIVGRCTNSCYLVGGAYGTADNTLNDLLPDLDITCPA